MLAAAMALAFIAGPDTLVARAESLLAAGALPSARRIAERLERERPRDPRVLMLLGRIHLDWPVVGRFAADSLFRRASALAPDDPEPHYYGALAGIRLGGDDGESMARRHLEKVLALDPGFRDAWSLWSRLYRADPERRRAAAALAAHAGLDVADLWRAGLLVELHDYPRADSLLVDLTGRLPAAAAPWALLAQSRFEQGEDEGGSTAYQEALERSRHDPDGVLWRQVRGVATPSERAAWQEGPADPAAFLRLFWARRDPLLATRLNERLGEHFRRAAEARRRYALLHPASRWHHSARWRALAGEVSPVGGPGFARAVADARAAQCAAEIPGSADLPYALGQAWRTTGDRNESPNLEDGLDDRGRVYLRHGAPRVRHAFADGETWCYEVPGGWLRVTFIRRTGGFDTSGDLVFTPVLSGEVESAALLTTTDRPSLEANLRFSFWPAAFRDRSDVRLTELLLFPDSLQATAVLVDGDGREAARDTATGRSLRLAARPGRYALLLDGVRGRDRGLYRGTVELPDLAGGGLALSGLLVAGGATPARRDSMAAGAPLGLRVPAAEPVRVYAEVYGLAPRGGQVRYEARYRFERVGRGFLGLGGERVTTISFTRERPADPRVVESLVIDPGRLPRGRYRVTVTILDLEARSRTSSAVLNLELR